MPAGWYSTAAPPSQYMPSAWKSAKRFSVPPVGPVQNSVGSAARFSDAMNVNGASPRYGGLDLGHRVSLGSDGTPPNWPTSGPSSSARSTRPGRASVASPAAKPPKLTASACSVKSSGRAIADEPEVTGGTLRQATNRGEPSWSTIPEWHCRSQTPMRESEIFAARLRDVQVYEVDWYSGPSRVSTTAKPNDLGVMSVRSPKFSRMDLRPSGPAAAARRNVAAGWHRSASCSRGSGQAPSSSRANLCSILPRPERGPR